MSMLIVSLIIVCIVCFLCCESLYNQLTCSCTRYPTQLKEELSHVQEILQDEPAIYETSNQALNLVAEAQNEVLKHARAARMNMKQQRSTEDELKEFDILAKKYAEALKEAKQMEKSGTESNSPQEEIF